MALTQVSSEGIKDAQVKTADILDANITTAKIAADAVTGAKIADDAIDSEHYVDGSIDTAHIADDAVTTAKLANSINTDIAAKMPLAGGTITGDVVFDNATNAGNDITWDMSDNLLEFADDTGVSFGDGKDLQIYHDGSNSRINDTGTGKLILAGDEINLNNAASSEYCLRTIENGAVELYHNGTEMFYTSASGCHVGSPSTAAHLHFLDGGRARFGSGTDLEIYHDGSHSLITDSGTGNLRVQTNNLRIENAAGTENQALFTENGAVELYYDNSKKFETTADGVSVSGDLRISTDNDYIGLGTDNDLQIRHTGSAATINNSTGNLNIQTSGNIWVTNQDDSEVYIKVIANAAVELYYDNSKKLETTSTGIDIPDTLRLSGGYADTGTQMCLGADSGGAAYIAAYVINIQTGNNNSRSNKFTFNHDHFSPAANNSYDLGTTSLRWRNVYVNDLQLSNEAKKDEGGNDVDGTWGNYTIQEGEDDLFLINRRNGKKYKFNLTEVS